MGALWVSKMGYVSYGTLWVSKMGYVSCGGTVGE